MSTTNVSNKINNNLCTCPKHYVKCNLLSISGLVSAIEINYVIFNDVLLQKNNDHLNGLNGTYEWLVLSTRYVDVFIHFYNESYWVVVWDAGCTVLEVSSGT